mgnify:CR=1 FL=1
MVDTKLDDVVTASIILIGGSCSYSACRRPFQHDEVIIVYDIKGGTKRYSHLGCEAGFSDESIGVYSRTRRKVISRM